MDEERAGYENDGSAGVLGGEENQLPEETLRLKYNGEEMELPVGEIVTLAQKGMNYDKILSRVQSAEQDGARGTKAIEKMAGACGMTPEEYLDELESGRFEEIFGGALLGKAPEAEDRPGGDEDGAPGGEGPDEEAALDGFIALVEKYPGLKELPEEAAALVRGGVPPLYAYEATAGHRLAEENARLRAGIAAAQADGHNRATTPGSAKSLGEAADSDPFLSGFQRGG